MSWSPPPRPDWLRRLIAHGDAIGGPEHLVSLDPSELLETAIASTGGLDDFGDGDWRDWYELLVDALERESRLHVAGRLLVRHDLLRCLRNRLFLFDLWKREPQVLERQLLRPTFVVGMARSGTSILSELLSLDSQARCPAMWEMLHPVEATRDDALRKTGDDETVLMQDLAPEYATMHANSGDLPNECMFITLNTFASDHWGGTHVVPSYDAQLFKADHRPMYRFHERVLKTLQARGADGCTRWGLKAPSHLGLQQDLFAVYPQALVIRIHRDPLKSLPSMINLMGTLRRMRCEGIDISDSGPRIARGNAFMLQQEIEKRADGRIPQANVIDVRYHDLMRDLPGTIRAIYDRAGWELRDDVLARMQRYIADRPKGAHGVHAYSLEAVGLAREREVERFAFYRERYDVPLEG